MAPTRRVPLCRALFLSLMLMAAAESGEVIGVTVEHHGKRFVLHSEVLIHVAEPKVRAILSRYEELPRINRGIKAVKVMERRDAGRVRMQLLAEACILLICVDYTWIQEVHTLANGDIVATIDPVGSDFREGWTRWALLPEAGNTRLVFDASVIPNFWFPPALGAWLIERKLAREALETALEVEKLGRAEP